MSKRVSRIIQLTDTHLNVDGKPARGFDSTANFLKILESALTRKPDMIIVTGDLCMHNPLPSVYRWMKKILGETGIPYRVQPGNHDETAVMEDIFGTPMEGDINLNGEKILLLDSSASVLTDWQLSRIEGLAEIQDRVIIFTHYPPALMGSRFMDENYPLKNRTEVMKRMTALDVPILFYTGHYHLETWKTEQNVQIYVAPSTWLQIDPSLSSFRVLSEKPGYRIIDISKTVETDVISL